MEIVPLLQRLIAVDSTSTRPNVPVLDLLEEVVRPLGFETRRQRWLDEEGVEKGNLVCRRGFDIMHLAVVTGARVIRDQLRGIGRPDVLLQEGQARARPEHAHIRSHPFDTSRLGRNLHENECTIVAHSADQD